jgi:branched-chain amino acid transport system substrate-binding protein
MTNDNPNRRHVLKGAAAVAGAAIFAPAVHANPAPLKLGTLASLEGPLAANGQDAYRVVELLLEEANYTAGGRKIEWIRESSNAKPDVALARTRKLVEQDGVDIVLGPLSGAEGIAVRDYSRTVPTKTFINGSSASQDNTLRNSSPNYFRFNTDGTQWTAGLGDYVKNALKIDEVTVVASDYAFGYSQVFGFSLEYTRAGGKINYLWSPFGTSDYTSLIAQIPKSSGALYVVYGGSDGLAFLTQYAQAGGSLPLLGGTLLADQTLFAARGPHRKVLEGTVSAGPIGDHYDNEVWKDFLARYTKRWSKDIGQQTPGTLAFAYSINLQATLLALKAVDGDLSNDQAAFREALKKLEFKNYIDATVKLDHNRQAISDNFLNKVEVRDGRLQTVVFKKISNINQTLGFPEDKYIALGAPSRNNPGNVQI